MTQSSFRGAVSYTLLAVSIHLSSIEMTVAIYYDYFIVTYLYVT